MQSILLRSALLGTLSVLGCGEQDPQQEPTARLAGDIWGADYFPNTALVTHDGRTVRFFDDLVEGKVVAINFIYTHCPDACPMETARMMDVKRILGDRVGKDVHFYSITIDPERDTPEVLASYVEKWGIGEGWTFLTGNPEDITALRKKLGVYSELDADQELRKDHNLSLVIGNQTTGRWMKRSPYENPYVLATQLGSWLQNWKMPSEGGRDIEDAPPLRAITSGESVFRTRCASCHTIGGGDVSAVADRRAGPDLYNISKQRDRSWLIRWIIEPDVVLAEGDETATRLVDQYRIAMPNLRMTEIDANHVLEYIDQESARLDATLAARPNPSGAAHGHAGHH